MKRPRPPFVTGPKPCDEHDHSCMRARSASFLPSKIISSQRAELLCQWCAATAHAHSAHTVCRPSADRPKRRMPCRQGRHPPAPETALLCLRKLYAQRMIRVRQKTTGHPRHKSSATRPRCRAFRTSTVFTRCPYFMSTVLLVDDDFENRWARSSCPWKAAAITSVPRTTGAGRARHSDSVLPGASCYRF
jgi:hypothetical protein